MSLNSWSRASTTSSMTVKKLSSERCESATTLDHLEYQNGTIPPVLAVHLREFSIENSFVLDILILAEWSLVTYGYLEVTITINHCDLVNNDCQGAIHKSNIILLF